MNEKPSMGIIFQVLLNLMSRKGTLKERGLTFLNESTIDAFIRKNLEGSEELSKITYD